MIRKRYRLFALGIIALILMTGCKNSENSSVKQIETAKQAVDPVLVEAFIGRSQEEAMNLLGLTEDAYNDSSSGDSHYNATYSFCGMELNTKLYFGFDTFTKFTAETTLDDSGEARKAAEACVQLFRKQFPDYGYTQGTISEGVMQSGTNFMYEEGSEEEVFRKFWVKEDGAYLSFRFYLNEEKNAHEWIECLFSRSDIAQDQINLHFEGSRTLAALQD